MPGLMQSSRIILMLDAVVEVKWWNDGIEER